MIFSLLLFGLFTILATGGAYWLGVEYQNKRFAVLAALATLLTMSALMAALWFWVWPMLTEVAA